MMRATLEETIGRLVPTSAQPVIAIAAALVINIAITIVVLSGTASLDALDLLIQDFLLFQIQTGQLQTSFRSQ